MNYSHSCLLFGSNGAWLCYTGQKTGGQKSVTWGTCALIRECERRRMRVRKLCKPDSTLAHAFVSVGMFCSWAPASWSVYSAVVFLWIQAGCRVLKLGTDAALPGAFGIHRFLLWLQLGKQNLWGSLHSASSCPCGCAEGWGQEVFCTTLMSLIQTGSLCI